MSKIVKLGGTVLIFIQMVFFAISVPVHADYLTNTDLQQGMGAWHGEGETVFLKPDGTEGEETDPGAVAVLKMKLSPDKPRYIFQEIRTRDHPATLHLKVDIFVSDNFQASKSHDDYTPELSGCGGAFEWASFGIPQADFWIKAGPSTFRDGNAYDYFVTGNAVKGKWATIDHTFDTVSKVDDRVVYFCVPPGIGTLYLKNPSATP
jgi:hypothetical protein